MKRYTLATDLINNAQLIKEYDAYHENMWPEIKVSIINSGIINMEIYRFENRLFMIMDVNDDFTFEKKALNDSYNKNVKHWKELLQNYEKSIPGATENGEWVVMKKIFHL